MNSLVRTLKSLCFAFVLFVLIAIPHFLTAAAESRHQAKAQRRGRTERIQSSARSGRPMRRTERRRIEARRRAEVARLAAIARQRALDEARRDQVQSMIAKDDTTGEDMEVRRVAVNALGNRAGTVVVMDPKTGRVYSIVNQQWALREGFKPCSTIKLVTGIAGLNERVIDPSDTTTVAERYHIDLTDALAYSNNAYFQQVGGRVGFDKMISYARRLGLGEKTGINAGNEFQGRVPTFKSGFAVNHMSSHGDDFKVTALQLATLVSAMTNGGKLLTPHVPRTPQEAARFKPRVRRLVDIDPGMWRYMIPGMVGSVSYGSGRRAHDPLETIAGKTGTCIEQGTWVGLFVSYAPLTSPRLAVVVIARGSDAQGHFPAAVAGRIYRDLNHRFGMSTNLQVAAVLDSNAAAKSADSRTALNEGEKDEADADQSDEANDDSEMTRTSSASTTTTRQTAPRAAKNSANNKVRRVLMAIPPTEQRVKSPTAPKGTLKAGPQAQQRPRRVNDNRQ